MKRHSKLAMERDSSKILKMCATVSQQTVEEKIAKAKQNQVQLKKCQMSC